MKFILQIARFFRTILPDSIGSLPINFSTIRVQAITGIVFALAAHPKNLPMTQNLANLEVKVLEQMYLKEIEILKFKLLNGAIVREIQKQKIKAKELALAIHEKQINGIFPRNYLME